ncbi:hypothetical protein NGM37_23570, partial [Streptomyces sp. TRM76130]|nr:hypothetical protein [Streptomyces sp. TRM76130]
LSAEWPAWSKKQGRATRLEGHECCFGDVVVAGGEELAQTDILPAAAPAFAGRDEARLLVAWHNPK